MTFWSFLLVGGILLWVAAGKLINSDSHAGKAARALIAAVCERIRGKGGEPSQE